MTGLRGLVEKATPGPWEFDGFEHVVSTEVADIVCGVWQGKESPDDARLIALAPVLALWAADAADALASELECLDLDGIDMTFHRDHQEPDGGAWDCKVCTLLELLARFAVIEHTAQEDTP